ncbi:DUF6081 family protein [Thermomonospora umbrina]|uniref:Uncharacterized protein n=1 Tax=Thermomonospora umbrina TaxID=111806 RepID=A0A3D9SUN1_9ACTN|nr:DUF6081 family protein [Thermomonospora umbrina]REE96264.1 hypothetical protein DFJ69_1694 [Thermomonospora umbrina]
MTHGGRVGRTARPAVRTLFHDDFRDGLDTAARWRLRPRGGLEHGDGIVRCSSEGLTVTPTGTDPATGRPAFAVTYGQGAPEGGWNDHMKWVALTRHAADGGAPGFDVPATGALTCTVTLSGERHGVERHPFGAAVADPRADPRLGMVSMVMVDLEAHLVFGFALTDSVVYALYERPPAPGRRYASFGYAVPVADRTADRWHACRIRVDEGGGRVSWVLDGRTVLTTDRLGLRAFGRADMLLDHGGAEERVRLRRLACGLGLFTLLDGAGPDGGGLVRLDAAPDFYLAPRDPGSRPQSFVDERSLPENRIWGAGAVLRARAVDIVESPH